MNFCTQSHNEFTHFPLDPNCEICQSAKPQRSGVRSKIYGRPDDLPQPKEFGDGITADHAILNDILPSDYEKVASIIQDRFTSFMMGFPARSKNALETRVAFQRYLGPEFRRGKVGAIYTDNSKEFEAAIKSLCYIHDTSTPHRPQTNGVAERAVKRAKEGTSAVLVQSGLSDDWWPEAMRTYCHLRNIIDIQTDGKTAWEKRFGAPFRGPAIPFGCLVSY